MRGLNIICAAVAVFFVVTMQAWAMGSNASVQELGAVIPANDIVMSVGVKSLSFPAAGVTLGAGTANGTVGGTTFSSLNFGLGNGFEVRTGYLPGVSAAIGNAQGITVKHAGLVPGLALYGAYGYSSSTSLGTTTASTTSSTRVGAAFTAPVGGFFLNANLQGGTDTPAAGAATNVTEYAFGAFYPVRENILLGCEYVNSNMVMGATTINMMGYGLGINATIEHFTIGVVLFANATETISGIAGAANTVQIGAPAAISLSYKF